MTPETNGALSGVETRRFRTWESDAPVASDGWRIVFRYAMERTRRSWHSGLLLVAVGVALIFQVGAVFSEGSQSLDTYLLEMPVAIAMFATAVVILLVGAPSIAEDRRFNAPLLYFSKPLRPESYVAGKAAHLGAMLGALVVAPMVLVLLAIMVASLGVQGPPAEVAADPERLEDWGSWRIDSVGEAVTLSLALFPAAVVGVGWLGAVMIMASSYTTRAWHAALAAVAIVGVPSMAGSMVGAGVGGVKEGLLGPVQWLSTIIWLPVELTTDQSINSGFGARPQYYDGATGVILGSYALLLLTGWLAMHLTMRRMRSVEAML